MTAALSAAPTLRLELGPGNGLDVDALTAATEASHSVYFVFCPDTEPRSGDDSAVAAAGDSLFVRPTYYGNSSLLFRAINTPFLDGLCEVRDRSEVFYADHGSGAGTRAGGHDLLAALNIGSRAEQGSFFAAAEPADPTMPPTTGGGGAAATNAVADVPVTWRFCKGAVVAAELPVPYLTNTLGGVVAAQVRPPPASPSESMLALLRRLFFVCIERGDAVMAAYLTTIQSTLITSMCPYTGLPALAVAAASNQSAVLSEYVCACEWLCICRVLVDYVMCVMWVCCWRVSGCESLCVFSDSFNINCC